jgi:hypothetical protein
MAQPDEDLAPGDHLSPDERALEAPEADAAEQATLAGPARDDDLVRHGFYVDEADAAEQSRVVDFDDDYR